MDKAEYLSVNIEIPFPSNRQGEIVYQALKVDVEPTRKNIKKKLVLRENKLIVDLTAPDARSLRIGVNSFMDFVILSTETMEKFGPPVSESYSH